MRMRIFVSLFLAVAVMAGTAYGETAIWKVATVHGANQFDISADGSQLLYHGQPRNTSGWYWVNNNGSLPGVLAIGGLGPNGWRDGSRTFAVTDAGYGQTLNTIKLVFSYYAPEGVAGWSYPSMNFFITDGLGRYGIWSPASGGVQYFSQVRNPAPNQDWMTMTLDLTNPALDDTLTGFAVYEHNGVTTEFVYPYTTVQWGDIKNYKIAGFYDYQRNPATGWANWSDAFADISNAWNSFIIRNATTSGNPPQINNITWAEAPAKEFVISEGGMKAGWGTRALDGKKVRDIGGCISRLDSLTSAPYAPYFNIWVTDGNGKFAVIANEPSNPEWLSFPGSSRNFDWAFLSTKTVKVYENTDKTWFPNNGVGLTFNDLADYTILAPTADQLTTGWAGLGGGAPRELGTNKAYGFNWIFGDTLSNYVSGDTGYVVTEPAVIKDGPVNNRYGIALIWGDTVTSGNPSPYATYQRLIKDVVLTAEETDYTAEFENAQSGPNCLSLDATAQSLYVKPGESVIVDMNAENLQQMVAGCQALIGYSSTYFPAPGAVTAGGGVWNELVYESWATAGELDTAIGVQLDGIVGTMADGKVAYITLTAGTTEGTTKLQFRADGEGGYATMFSGLEGEAIYPVKIDSTDIIIDGTAPTDVTISAVPASWTNADAVDLTFSATDALAGIDHYELAVDGGTPFAAESVYTLDVSGLADGEHTVTVTAYDKAGNSASASTSFYLDNVAPTIGISDNIGADPVLQGVYTVTVSAGDAAPSSGLAGDPVVMLDGNVLSGTNNGDGTWTYTVTVDGMTANGLHTITADISDQAGNAAVQAVRTFTVNKNEIEVSVELQGFVGSSRAVTFEVKNAANAVIMAQTVTVDSFTGAVGTCTLTNVPDGAATIWAKTAWNLASKVAVFGGPDNQWTATLIGADKLLGGDLDGSNMVNIQDYSRLKMNWLTTNPSADVNGNGQVNLADYSILQSNFFKAGDAK